MKCKAHDLGAGPDGQCVLCRQTAEPAPFAAGRMLGLLVSGVVLIAGGALAFKAVRGKTVAQAEPSAVIAATNAALVEDAVTARPVVEPPPVVGAVERFAPLPSPGPVVPERADAGTVPSGVVATGPPPPTDAAIQAALRATPIVMFATSWCPVCTRARAFLDANGLKSDERDIDRDERARAELKRLTGKASVPTFLVDGVLVGPGFSESNLTRALVQSTEERLGVRGLSVRTAESR